MTTIDGVVSHSPDSMFITNVAATDSSKPVERPAVDWREELEHALYANAQELHEQRCAIAEARGHVTGGLILGEKYLTVGLYAASSLRVKSTYNLLERARAYRTGQPIPPPVSLDLTISKGTDAIGI